MEKITPEKKSLEGKNHPGKNYHAENMYLEKPRFELMAKGHLHSPSLDSFKRHPKTHYFASP